MQKTALSTLLLLLFCFANAVAQPNPAPVFTKEKLHDRILGLLVGSAIGDAMGGPIEMWGRHYITANYGWVSAPVPYAMGASPESIWVGNLPAGGTTDDTRWKVLAVRYLTQKSGGKFRFSKKLDARAFAQFITDEYLRELKALKATDGFDPAPYEAAQRRVQWLQEWALTAKPFAENDLLAYNDAVSKFYGGEMVCAGLLYAPVVGGFFPGDPALAYDEAFRLSIFDIGYARDLTALTAAMTAAALSPNCQPDSLWEVLRTIDPHDFNSSRLVGRNGYKLFWKAQDITHQARLLKPEQASYYLPSNFRGDTLQFYQMQKAFELLDAQNQDAPFHAGEIYLINLTALWFSNLDFQVAMEFVANFGRDNDTVAAVTGGILGAYHGFAALPDYKREVMRVNKDLLGNDLEALAKDLTEAVWAGMGPKK